MTSEQDTETSSTPSRNPSANKSTRIRQLIAVTNARVAENLKPGSNAYSGWLADIRCGIAPSIEGRALAVAAPFLAGLAGDRRTGAVRAAAIRAKNKRVRELSQDSQHGRSLGRSLRHLSMKDVSVEAQVKTLPLLDLNAAALAIDSLVGRCAGHGVSIDFYDLSRTLAFWGHGATTRSRDTRNRIVLDFYYVDEAEMSTEKLSEK